MPMFKPILDLEAKGKVKEVFDEIKSTRKIIRSSVFGNILLIAQKLWKVLEINFTSHESRCIRCCNERTYSMLQFQ